MRCRSFNSRFKRSVRSSRCRPIRLCLIAPICIAVLYTVISSTRISRATTPSADAAAPAAENPAWEAAYQERLQWWSLQPFSEQTPAVVGDETRVRNDVDRFIVKALESQGLQLAPAADRCVLARRLSFALTGLPPSREQLNRFLNDETPEAEHTYVNSLLASPHFGEHWARHWMDVVHYADTHGYEWDVPAKNAWMYRDYLVRAWNSDVPFQQLVLEQIAGDLVEPRIDPTTGANESLIGTMALRLGERRHGDNAAAEGVSQEAMTNTVDTISKAFLATTVACAQCHDHKLDAIAQQDFYALTGTFTSSRWLTRCVETTDRNAEVIAQLRQTKHQIRQEMAAQWRNSRDFIVKRLQAIPPKQTAADQFPETLVAFWQRMQSAPIDRAAYDKERSHRVAHNKEKLKLLADFSQENASPGWQWEGSGMRHGLVDNGELVIADEGPTAVAQVLPAGRWSHVWSKRLAGAVRSPLFDSLAAPTISMGIAGGQYAGYTMIVDQAFHSERLKFLKQPSLAWLTITAGKFDTLAGGIDDVPRRAYLEIATKSLNTYFPPRTGYGGVKESDLTDERSWFGLTQVYEHQQGEPPLDDLERFAPLFQAGQDKGEVTQLFCDVLLQSVRRWADGACSSDDARLLDEALQAKLLPDDTAISAKLLDLVTSYRSAERRLQPDRTIGSIADWQEGRNDRIGLRGSYTDFGTRAPRGNIRFLGGPAQRATETACGRLELARNIASEKNPLTARVFVNRVWVHLFGVGLVRTPDDFGHLGEKPSHPELLDYLAKRFMDEGWSLKKLVAYLVDSATWRQSNATSELALERDPENRLCHHMPVRRLEAESLRDSMLFVSGRLDSTLAGPPIDPYRTATDPAKRLVCGPLDGNGRRSIYLKMTLMEPPRFLAVFNQPIPRLTSGRRDVTNVPTQALTLLNDPFVVAMARYWSEQLLNDKATSPTDRATNMFETALGRTPTRAEADRLVHLAQQSAELHGNEISNLMKCQPAWQDAAHAIFNLKEFLYVP